MKPFRNSVFKLLDTILIGAGILGFANQQSWGAACCARSSATPTLILGEDSAQVGVGASVGAMVAEASEDGAAIFRSPHTSDITQSFRMDGAFLLSDRWQAGLSVTMTQHRVSQSRINDSTFGMGDSRISLAYEWLPSWTYSVWRPQSYLFTTVTLPTGKSVYDSNSNLAADVTGNGFYSFSLGSIFLKRWVIWDVFFMPEVHYSLPRDFAMDSRNIRVFPGFGGSMGIGGGVSPGAGPIRLGMRIQPRLDQARLIPAVDARAQERSVLASCDVGFDLSLLIGTQDTIMVSYTDQTLLGPAMNSNLNRSLGVNFQHRWER